MLETVEDFLKYAEPNVLALRDVGLSGSEFDAIKQIVKEHKKLLIENKQLFIHLANEKLTIKNSLEASYCEELVSIRSKLRKELDELKQKYGDI